MIFVSQQMLNAAVFLEGMPEDLPYPEFCEDPDGDVSIDWMTGKYKSVSASIGMGLRVPYAAVIDGFSTHGVTPYDRWDELANLVRKIM